MSNHSSLKDKIISVLKKIGRPAHIKEIHEHIEDKPESTIRGRLNEGVSNEFFVRVARGVYWFASENGEGGVLVVPGNGRDLSMFEDASIDAIITDHPWEDPKSNKGGCRNFDNTYDKFRYNIFDFVEKARVLKDGHFLAEILPAENENNYKYLYEIKQMAEKCGLVYYAKVSWKKGTFVSNTGRKSKNTEDVMFFTKGKARNLRPDKKKMKNEGGLHYMSGTTEMLPTMFDYQPTHISQRIHQAEKPIELYEAILEYITMPGEIVIDQFAGSGNLGVASVNKNRFAVLFEILQENIEKMCDRLSTVALNISESVPT